MKKLSFFSILAVAQVALTLSPLFGFGDREQLQDMRYVVTTVQVIAAQVEKQKPKQES